MVFKLSVSDAAQGEPVVLAVVAHAAAATAEVQSPAICNVVLRAAPGVAD